LGDRERALQRGLRHDKRRRDWRRGRWAAKQALATCWPEREHADIEVLPDELGAPRVHLDDRLRPTPISISHRQDLALCALGAGSSAPSHRLGCDLEHVEERSEAFVSDFFCSAEQAR
jgi:4'-phosphopantetheinyl transferase EntD